MNPIDILTKIDPTENQTLIEKASKSIKKRKGSPRLDRILKTIEITEFALPIIIAARTWHIMDNMEKSTDLHFYLFIRIFLLVTTLISWFLASKVSYKYAAFEKKEGFLKANLIESSIYLLSIISLSLYKLYCIYILDWVTPISWLEEGFLNVKTSCVFLSALIVYGLFFPIVSNILKSERFQKILLKV